MAGNVVQALLRLAGDASGAMNALKQVEEGLSGVEAAGKRLQNVGGAMTKYVTAPLVAAGGVAGKMALDFDEAMRSVNTVVKAGSEQFQQMKKDVLDLSTTTSRSSVEVAEAYKYAASTGMEAASAQHVLKHSLDAASNMSSNANTVIRAATKTMQAFGLETSDTTHILDVLQTAATQSSAEFEPLVDNISKVTGIAAAAKIPFEEVTAALMSASDAGYDMAEATTAMARLIQELIDPSDDLLEMFQAWGYESGEAALAAEGFVGVMQRIDQETGGTAAALSELFPNIRAMRGAFALTGGNAELFAESLDKVSHASDGVGEHARLVEERHKSLNYQIQRTKSFIEILAIRMGSSFIPVLEDVVKVLRGAAEAAANMSDRSLRIVTTIGAVAAATGPAAWALGTFLRSLQTIVGAAQAVRVVLINTSLAFQAYAAGASAAEVASIGLAGKLAVLGALALPIAGAVAGIAALYVVSKKYVDQLAESKRAWMEQQDAFRRMGKGATEAARAQYQLQKAAEGVQAAFELGVGTAERVNELSRGQINDYKEMGRAADDARSNVVTLAEAQEESAKKAAEAAEKAAEAQERINQAANELMTAIRGPVGQAQEEYRAKHQEITEALAEEQEKLEELETKHGVYVDTLEQLVEAQAKQQQTGERLAEAQEAYNKAVAEGADDVVQYEASLVDAEAAHNKANQAVARGPGYYTDYRDAITETQGKIDELNQNLAEAAAAHREHIQSIIFDMIQARLAAAGWSEESYNLALATAESMDLIDQETVRATKRVNRNLSLWQEGAITTGQFLARMASTVDGAMDESARAVEEGTERQTEAQEKMAEDSRNILEEVAVSGQELTDEYLSSVKENFSESRRAVGESMKEMKDDVTGATGETAKQGELDFIAMKDAATTESAQIQKIVTTWIGQIPGKLRDYVGNFWGAGRDLANGIKHGLESRIGAIANAARATVVAALNAARAAAGARSPSVRMMELGIDLIRGLIVGVDREGPEAVEKVKDIVSSVVEAFDELLSLAQQIGAIGALTVPGVGSELPGARENLNSLADWVEALRGVLAAIADRLRDLSEETTDAIAESAEMVGLLDKLMGNLTSFGKSLIGITDIIDEIGVAMVYGVPTKTYQDIVFALERLADWVLMLAYVLTDIAERKVPALDAASQALVERAGGTIDALAGVVDGLKGFAESLVDVVDVIGEIGHALIYTTPTETYQEMVFALERLADWVLMLAYVLTDIAERKVPALSESAQDALGAAATVTDRLSRLVQSLTRFGGALAEVGEAEGDIEEGVERFEAALPYLRDALDRTLPAMVELAEQILADWEDEERALADRLGALASVVNGAVRAFRDTLRLVLAYSETELSAIQSGVDLLLETLDTLKATMSAVVLVMISLSLQLVTDWEEGASAIAGASVAASGMIAEAFRALEQVARALSRMVDMMANVARLTGSERLEEEDWAGLAWGITRALQVVRTGLTQIAAQTSGFDADAIVKVAEVVRTVGEAIGALSGAFADITVSVPPTEGAIDDFLASLVDAYHALQSYTNFIVEVLEDPFSGISWYDYGAAMMDSLIDGIESRMGDLEAVLEYIRSLLPSSPAKRGPLSEPVDWGYLVAGLPDVMHSVEDLLSGPALAVGIPDLAAVGASVSAGDKHIELHAHYPSERPHDFRRQMRQVELLDRYD